jgi:hypothetical protein
MTTKEIMRIFTVLEKN